MTHQHKCASKVSYTGIHIIHTYRTIFTEIRDCNLLNHYELLAKSSVPSCEKVVELKNIPESLKTGIRVHEWIEWRDI